MESNPRNRNLQKGKSNESAENHSLPPAISSQELSSGAQTEPLISIGMAVFNGERYLSSALHGILRQDYPNFELIISDNASSDGTEEICGGFQKSDSRVRYIRQAENRGAAWNFAFVARQARGPYFLWAAHDDVIADSYIRKCLAKLQEHPSAVLCCTEITFIDAEGCPHPEWSKPNNRNIDTLGMTPPQRIHELLGRFGWFAIYGLMALEITRKLSLGLNCYGFDVILLAELMFLGDFVMVQEPLFRYRIVKAKSAAEYHAVLNSANSREAASESPLAGLAVALLAAVNRSSLSSRQKLEVFADFVYTLTRQNPDWRREISRELLGPHVELKDAQFALLLGLVLSRSLPMEMMHAHPLIQAFSADNPEHFLDVSTQLRGPIDAPGPKAQRRNYDEGVRLFGKGEFEEASRLFRQSLEQHESSDHWHDWAIARLACKQMEDAEHGLRRALVLDPGNRQAILKLGLLLAGLRRDTEAIPFLEQSAGDCQEPERTEVSQLLAACRANLG
jgi:tetratricopeptide (TPR) repeat protein